MSKNLFFVLWDDDPGPLLDLRQGCGQQMGTLQATHSRTTPERDGGFGPSKGAAVLLPQDVTQPRRPERRTHRLPGEPTKAPTVQSYELIFSAL
jgi:hypothetical protein